MNYNESYKENIIIKVTKNIYIKVEKDSQSIK